MSTPHPDYFTGRLLDADSFRLEQSYFGGRRRHLRTAVWIELAEESGFEAWSEVVDFCSSGPEDRHFVLDRQQGVIRFGDGKRGRRPVLGARVRGWYRRGAGSAGDVPPTRSDVLERLAEVSHFSWMRQKARDQGADYETLQPEPTDHDRERAEDTLNELARLGLLEPRAHHADS